MMTDRQFADIALQMVNSCAIEASEAEKVVAVKAWLQEIPNQLEDMSERLEAYETGRASDDG